MTTKLVPPIVLLTVVLLTTLPGVQAAPPPESVDFDPDAEAAYLYLPFVSRGPDPNPITLLSPANGAILDTLLPLFTWDMGVQPEGTSGCLAFGTDLEPTACQMAFPAGDVTQKLGWYNLEPSTTYYWRIGAIYNGDSDNPKWSEQWTLTTGANGIILPAATLVAPANNGSVPFGDVTLQWQPPAGAVEYIVYLHGIDPDLWVGFYSTEPQVTVPQSTIQDYGNHYEWFVMARNDYAWGDFSATWTFSVCDGAICPNP